VFLSGHGPLVAVLQEALTRDEYRRLNGTERKGAIKQRVKPFIQNVHHFRDEGVRSDAPPFDHVVIFDEAQRAWNREKTADFMKRKKGHAGFAQSEPEFLISYLDRHNSWAVVVCLVGGGQEIHTGEAGIGAWLEAVRCAFPNWRTYVSPDLSGSEYAATAFIDALDGVVPLERDATLHPSTSMRSFRSEKVSAFVTALLDCDGDRAREMLGHVTEPTPCIGSWGSRRIRARVTTSRTRRRSSRSRGSRWTGPASPGTLTCGWLTADGGTIPFGATCGRMSTSLTGSGTC